MNIVYIYKYISYIYVCTCKYIYYVYEITNFNFFVNIVVTADSSSFYQISMSTHLVANNILIFKLYLKI